MTMTRRTFIAAGAAGIGFAVAGAAASEGGGPSGGDEGGGGVGGAGPMVTRPIPRGGERLPVVGLGTWRTFDVGPGEAERAPRLEVLRRFLAAGGRIIDSSPMYGEAERVVGDLLAKLGPATRPFLATKVWTRGRLAGEAQMRESLRRLRVDALDLMQVHNLLDWQEHLPTLRAWKAAGRFRHLGVTHYSPSAFPELERLLRAEALEFVQLPYSAAARDAEARLLPAAAETGTAVLVMRPFEEGDLFRLVKGKPLPPWAPELRATSWSQVFLKFTLSHPAVTAVIPATANPDHLEENVKAGFGPMPDAALRRRMEHDLRF
jgi:aryl-alcohol dehydrogenase-like predicted oxidoreductase